MSPGVVSTVKNIVGNLARDPQYWLAFSQNVGNSYQNAVTMLEEKSLSDVISGRGEAMSQGEIRTKAALYALGANLMIAAIERSGGLQMLPEELQYGDDVWKLMVNSSVSEGKEETLQGILDRAMQTLMLGKDYKLMSFSDKDAVFSLPAAVDEFGTDTFVGGLLSGGQTAMHGVINPTKYAINVDGDVAINPIAAQTTVESVQSPTERDIIETTELWMQQINEAAEIHPEEVRMVDINGIENDPYSGVVEFKAPPNATEEQIAQVQAYIDGCNEAFTAGRLSKTGRVSTKGSLRDQASDAAKKEGRRARDAGTPYKGHVGHVPDTTWTGTPEPYSWLDLDPVVNTSLGGQTNRYPIGYKPTGFVFKEDE